MSESTKVVKGVVEGANRNGLKVDGKWHNYGYAYPGDRPGRDAIGQTVELELAGAENWVQAVKFQGPEPAPPEETPGTTVPETPGEKSMTPNQAAKVAELADNREITSERLALAVQILTGKTVERLTLNEASGLLQMLGARPFTSGKRFARRY